MKQERDDSVAHELRDRPAPPVKGAVTGQSDIRPRPEQTVRPQDSTAWNSLL